MKIGILQTGHAPENMDPTLGDYNELFTRFLAREGVEFVNFPVVDGIFPENIDAAQAWLITGSRFGVYENLPWMVRLAAFIRELYANNYPLVGICFGHQMIAQALGGRVEKFSGGWSIGEITYQRDDGKQGIDGEGQKLVAWHQDQVVELPEEAEVFGRAANCAYAMLRYKDKTNQDIIKALSFQPHPEFSQEFFEGLYEARQAGLPDDVKAKMTIPQETRLDRASIADEIYDFFNSKITSERM